MKCYKCKTENNTANIKCSNCGALLKFVCPKCKKVHPIRTLRCDCSYVFLKECSKCKTLNKNKNEICRKCGVSFSDGKHETTINALIKLVDFDLIEQKLKKNEASLKILNFFYQIVAKNAKKFNLKVIKKSRYVLEVKQNIDEDLIEDFLKCINYIESDITSFNEGLDKKIKTSLHAKIEILQDEDLVYKSDVIYQKEPELIEEKKEESSAIIEKESTIIEPEPPVEKIEKPILEQKTEKEEVNQEILKEPEPKEIKEEIIEEKEEEIFLEESVKPSYTLISRDNLFEVFNNNIKNSTSNFSMLLECEKQENPLILINNYVSTIQDKKFIYLLGNCSEFTNHTSFGLFNDVFKSLLGLSYFNMNEEDTKNIIRAFLKDNFALEDIIVSFFIDFILPKKEANIYNINHNKKKVYEAFEVLFSALLENSKVIFAINNTSKLDKDSYDLLVHLFNKVKFKNDLNILLIKNMEQVSEAEFDFEDIKLNHISKYTLDAMKEDEAKEYLLMLSSNNVILPIALEKEIIYNSKGKSSYIEEVFGLLIQKGALEQTKDSFKYNSKPVKIPETYDEVVKERVNDLFSKSEDVYNTLVLASLMGPKVNPFILNSILQFEQDKANEILGLLVTSGILIPFDNFNLVFKNLTVYNNIKESLNEAVKSHFIKSIIDAITKIGIVDKSVYFKLCLDANLKDLMLESYMDVEQELALKGANHLLLRIHNILLEVISELEIANKKELKYEILEKAGVLSHESNPQAAIDYLPKIVNSYEESEKFIEALNVAGYLTKSAMLQGDFNLAIECITKALHYIEENEEKIIERAFLNYIKLKPLFELGYYQEVINSAKNDILPVLKTVLSKKEVGVVSVEELREIILETEFYIAKSLTIQMHKDALEKLGEVDSKAKKDGNTRVLCEQNLYLALYYVLNGAPVKAKNILIDLQGAVSSGQLDMKNVILWRFTTLLNNLFTGEIATIKTEIENISIVANDLNLHFIEHSLNLISAKIEGSDSILYDELNYFAENKIATGALFCWYFIAQKELEKDDKKALQIAEQALEVCQKPEINNIYFEILFNKIIAEAYIINGDLELAQVHIENAYKKAKENHIYVLEAMMYVIFAKLFQEKASNNIDTVESADNANKLYLKAIEIANEIKNDYILNNAQKDLKDFMTFCQLSKIEF